MLSGFNKNKYIFLLLIFYSFKLTNNLFQIEKPEFESRWEVMEEEGVK